MRTTRSNSAPRALPRVGLLAVSRVGLFAVSRVGLCAVSRVGLHAVLLAVLLAALPAPEAGAHGGQFRGPGAPPSGPGMGPIPVPQVITPGETWQTWWDLNRHDLLPGRDVALRRQVVTPREGDAESLEEGWASRRLFAARTTVVPYLLRLVDPKKKHRDEVVAAALIALGKVSQERIVYPLFVRWLHDPRADDVVRESAALAMGLLRRTQPSLQQDGKDLDGLREELLRAIDDKKASVRVRAFAALGLGLLGDQPWGTSWSKDGRLVTRALWSRLRGLGKAVDLPVAILVALGMQPREGVPDEVRDGLKQVALGKAVQNRRWTPLERSHAFTALMRMGGPSAYNLLLRAMRRPSEPMEFRRAAYLALGRMIPRLDKEERIEAAEVLLESLKRRRDPLTSGLGLIAAGRLLGQDLADQQIDVLDAVNIPKVLYDAVKNGQSAERGFGAVALALAAKGAKESGLAQPLFGTTKNLLLRGLEDGRGDDRLVAAYAVGLGVLDVEEAIGALLDVARDVNADPVLRGHAAVAVGQMGRQRDEVMPVLLQMLREKRGVLLRVRAAMGLALLGGRLVKTQLLKELKKAKSEYHRAHVVIALGRLGDLTAIPAMMEYATDEKNTELARALAVVALGLLTDPEARPSILMLTRDANYPAGTQVLYSAYSIF